MMGEVRMSVILNPAHGNYSELVVPFGAHKGKTIEDIPTRYLHFLQGIEKRTQRDRELVRAAYLELAWREKHDAHFED